MRSSLVRVTFGGNMDTPEMREPVVDVNYSVVTKVPKRVLPSADIYSSIHQHLRAAAATLS